MTKKIDINKYITEGIGNEVSNFYDKQFLDATTQSLCFRPELKIIGYRKVKVPRYLTIKLPVIERWTDYDGEYSFGDLEGWIIYFKEFNLFRIGTRIEEEPVYEKLKPSKATIRFRRYSLLKQKKIIKKQINKLKTAKHP